MNGIGTPERPILIALFGATGVGKSSFANDASGGDLEVGKGLKPMTKEVRKSPTFQIDGRSVVVLDTPGFDDDEVSDVGTLKQIAGYLSSNYGQGQILSGIIYLHRITDNRMGGASARTFNLFRKMCGTQTLKNVIIATNMWSNPPSDDQKSREQQLQSNFFREALEGGARMFRRDTRGRESAHSILRHLIGQAPLPLRIDIETVDERKPLYETEVGQAVEVRLLERVNKQDEAIKEARRELEQAHLDEALNAIKFREEVEKEQNAMDELKAQIDSLRQGMEEERRKYRIQLEEEKRLFEREQARGRRIGNKIKDMFRFGSKKKAY